MKCFQPIVLTTFLLASSAFAGEHSALNGTWTLIPAKSDFAGQPVVQTGTVTIDDRQGNVSVIRNFVYEGAKETYFYKDMVDSERNATIHSGKDLKSKTRWDHDVLKVTTTQDGAVTVESYALGPDGTMTATVAKPGRQAITLVFTHK
jgi:hypothetical protein